LAFGIIERIYSDCYVAVGGMLLLFVFIIGVFFLCVLELL